MLPSSTTHQLEHITHRLELIIHQLKQQESTHQLELIIHQLDLTFHQLELFTAAKMVPKPKPKQQSWFDEGWFEQNRTQRIIVQPLDMGPAQSPINTPPESLPEYRSSAVAKSMFAKAFGPVMPSTTPIHIPVTRDATPYPGETFIILHKPSNRAITLYKDGIVGLGAEAHDFSSTSNSIPIHGRCNDYWGSSQCQWLCIEHKGWLGFRSATTGQYMSQVTMVRTIDDGGCQQTIRAAANHHGHKECFCVRRHPRGGYILMMLGQAQNPELRKIEIGPHIPRSLVLQEDGGALWEFVKVDGICG